MPDYNLLELLAAKVLEVEPDASEEEVESAYKDKAAKYHPDVSDEPQASERFKATQRARDILLGSFDFSDPNKVRTARSIFEDIYSESEVEEIEEESGTEQAYRSTAQQRSDPEAYDAADFMGMDREEREEMIQQVALGVETTIIYQGVSNLYEQGYDKDNFFRDINNYIGERHPESVTFEDYYEATKDSVRDPVTKDFFLDSLSKVQDELQSEYGDGTTLREVGRIVAYFVIQGGINLGHVGRFVGDSPFGRDERFGRDQRFDRRFGRDRRFDR